MTDLEKAKLNFVDKMIILEKAQAEFKEAQKALNIELNKEVT